jgi:adenine phosphoribosyltransferase
MTGNFQCRPANIWSVFVPKQNEQETVEHLRSLIRDIPDFPTPGILFRDITPLLADADAFADAVSLMAAPYAEIDHVVCIESRGFIFGAPIAYRLGAGIVPVRKAGKLPFETFVAEYALEYGQNTVEVHQDAIKPGERVIIVDDLLATGGTIEAAIRLVEHFGASLAGIEVLIELEALGGRERLSGHPVRSQIVY